MSVSKYTKKKFNVSFSINNFFFRFVCTHRNPGGIQNEPWCFVDRSTTDQSTVVHDIVREMCNIEKCSDKMWLYIISTFILFGLVIIIVTTILCCRKYRKRGMTNIQNVRSFHLF